MSIIKLSEQAVTKGRWTLSDHKALIEALGSTGVGTIEMASGISSKTGKGFVSYRWGDKAAQFTPEEARKHALTLLEVAEAAEMDEIVLAWMVEEGRMEFPDAVRAIGDLRIFRRKDQEG